MKNHRIVLILFAVLALATFTTAIVAQDTKPEPCPEVTVIGPPAELKENDIGDYSAIVDLKGIDQEILLEWNVIGGKVIEGQGTTNVKIKRTGDDFFVSVRMRGRRPRCEQVHRYRHVKSDLTPHEAMIVDRIIGPVTNNDEAKIKRFVQETRAERNLVFWVILGFKKNSLAADTLERRRILLASFDRNGRVGHDVRVTFVDVEAEEDFIEFWKTTPNARPPILDK